jgi:hypothetical protein
MPGELVPMRIPMRPASLLLALALVAVHARPASADATAFLGTSSNPSNRLSRGFSVGFGLIIVGFEFEYSKVAEDEEEGAPSLTFGVGNVLLQTPDVGTIQLYFTVGGGGYRERVDALDQQETNFAANTGGGVKIPLAGPLRLRVDYRLFKLRGSPLYSQTQRLYVGANVKF